MLDLVSRIIEQDRRTYRKMGAVVTDHPSEDVGMEKGTIEESGESPFEHHLDRTEWRPLVRR